MIRLSLSAEPLVAGVARMLDLEVENTSNEFVILGEARLSRGRATFSDVAAHSWRRVVDGVITYDAARDRYVHSSEHLCAAAVPLHVGVVPPGKSAEALVPVRLLASGSVALTVSYRHVATLDGRIYSAPSGVSGKNAVYAAGFSPGLVIVRESDLPSSEARVEVALTVEGDVPSGTVARSRALGCIEEGLRVGGVALAAEVLDALEAVFPGDPIVVVFRGAASEKVRAELGVEVNSARQGALDYERARELVTVSAKHGAALRAGKAWEGVVVE